MPGADLKRVLNRFYREYDFRERLLHDPIEIPHRYQDPADIEIAGFVAASLAYGKVGLFKPVAEKILSLMGRSPHDFLLHFSVARHARLFHGIRYRFNRSEDIVCMLAMVQRILRTRGSLEKLFTAHFRGEEDIGAALSGAVEEILSMNASKICGEDAKSGGLMQFFPSPARGSTCKRHNLFLRWMVRDRDIDFGIWKGIPKDRLVIPLDTHIMKISRCLGLTTRASAGWKTAVEITRSLRRFDPEDPLKYDFALCHQGISGLCRGESGATCADCVLRAD